MTDDESYEVFLMRLVRARLARIAEAHHKDIDEHGGSFGECVECGWSFPCPTHIWATTDRDPITDCWDPGDDTDTENEETA